MSQTPSLPVLATANDIRELVQFLKKRPSGVSVSDIAQPIKKRIFYPQKISAYEFWGLVSKTGEHVTLSSLGWEFAKSLEPEALVYRRLLAQTTPYISFLKELSCRQVDVITHEDVGQYWEEHHPEFVLSAEGGSTLRAVVCFFHLCQAAELGTMTIGKRGQPARLRILRDELHAYTNDPVAGGLRVDSVRIRNVADKPDKLRIYTSIRNGQEVLANQIREMLDLNQISGEIVKRNGSSESGIVSDEVLAALKRCQAAIMVISEDDYTDNPTGHSTLKESVLTEINAAFVLYERRVALLSTATMEMPANVKYLPWFTYDGGRLTWDSAVELMKVIEAFHR